MTRPYAARNRDPITTPSHANTTYAAMIVAPAAVIATLTITLDARIAFIAYHGLVCLALPATHALMTRGRGLRAQLEAFSAHGSGGRDGIALGAAVGIAFFALSVSGVAIADAFMPLDARFDEVGVALGAWGLPTTLGTGAVILFAYMLVGNSIAEELFWRGWVHARITRLPNPRNLRFLATILFASYHYFTVNALTFDPLLAGVATAGVFAAGLTWDELRARTGSVWPAILAHVGATAGYMTIYLLWIVT